MNNTITYNDFIQNILDTRGRFNCEGYKERHHIIPKCMGGTNEEDNLIDLYAREHFVAHKLLVQENPDNNKLAYALWTMSNCNNVCTPEEYEEAKAIISKARTGVPLSEQTKAKLLKVWQSRTLEERRKIKDKISKANKGKRWTEEQKRKLKELRANKPNPMLGRALSEETKRKISQSKKGTCVGEQNPMYGKKHTDEAKEKISIASKERNCGENNPFYGKRHDDETMRRIRKNNPLRRVVVALDKDTNEILFVCDSLHGAERWTGVDRSSIARCCKGKVKSAGGYVWAFADEEDKVK